MRATKCTLSDVILILFFFFSVSVCMAPYESRVGSFFSFFIHVCREIATMRETGHTCSARERDYLHEKFYVRFTLFFGTSEILIVDVIWVTFAGTKSRCFFFCLFVNSGHFGCRDRLKNESARLYTRGMNK